MDKKELRRLIREETKAILKELEGADSNPIDSIANSDRQSTQDLKRKFQDLYREKMKNVSSAEADRMYDFLTLMFQDAQSSKDISYILKTIMDTYNMKMKNQRD
jgi:hypothetical protein